MQWALYIVVFLFTSFIAYSLPAVFFGSRSVVLERLQQQTSSSDVPGSDSMHSRGLREDMLRFLGALGRIFSRRSYINTLQKKLIQAQIMMRAEEMIGLTIVLTACIFVFVYLVTKLVFMAVFMSILAALLPGFVVNTKKTKRMNALNTQLPEALAMIANALRAGYSFPQAMFVVSQEMEAPISDEFGRVVRENRLGRPMENVLNDLTERTDNDDLDMVVTALLIQKQVGGNLAEILNKIEHTIRERIRIRLEIRTLTAQQRLSAAIIAFLPFIVVFILLLLNPEYILTLFQTTIGLLVLCTALLLQLFGMVLIRRIVKIEI